MHPGGEVVDVEGVVAQPVPVGAESVPHSEKARGLPWAAAKARAAVRAGQGGLVPGVGRGLGTCPALVIGVEADDVDVGIARVGQSHVVARASVKASTSGFQTNAKVSPRYGAHGGDDLVEVGGKVWPRLLASRHPTGIPVPVELPAQPQVGVRPRLRPPGPGPSVTK